MMDADVVVVGVGAMGSMAAWRLAARGARVLAFDQFEPPHDRGSSHGESRIIRTAYFEGPGYVPLLRRAFELWRQLERESGTSILTMTGALMIGRPESAVIAGTLESVRAHGLAHEVLDRDAMAARYPQHRLDADELGIYEADAGLLRPERGVAAAIARAESLGATVRRDTPVAAIDVVGSDEVRVTAGDEVYVARHVVVSAGSWLGDLLPQVRTPLRVERQTPAWFPVHQPALYGPERFPVFVRALRVGDGEGDDRHRYGFPTLDGATAKVAIHHEGVTTRADALDRTVYAETSRRCARSCATTCAASRRRRRAPRCACTPIHPTSTSSSARCRACPRLRCSAASRGTATNSCPSSATSRPTSPSWDAHATPSTSSRPTASRTLLSGLSERRLPVVPRVPRHHRGTEGITWRGEGVDGGGRRITDKRRLACGRPALDNADHPPRLAGDRLHRDKGAVRGRTRRDVTGSRDGAPGDTS